MNGGQVILADEPTGALDSHSGEEVMAILRQLRDRGHTVIIVTHDPLIAARAGAGLLKFTMARLSIIRPRRKRNANRALTLP